MSSTKIIDFSQLVIFYKLIFNTLNVKQNDSSVKKSRAARIKYFLKSNKIFSLLVGLFVLLFFVGIHLKIYSNDRNRDPKHIYLYAFFTVYTLTFLNLLQSALYSDHLDNLWAEMQSTNDFIMKRLKHKICFRRFLKSYIIICSVCLVVFLVVAIIRIHFHRAHSSRDIQCILVFWEANFLYTKLHAIFVIRLFQYIYKLLGKYVNLAYKLNSSNMVFSQLNAIQDNLRFYKEIHCKFWTISDEINNFFGLSFITVACRSFFDVLLSLYFILHNWDSNSSLISKFISKI